MKTKIINNQYDSDMMNKHDTCKNLIKINSAIAPGNISSTHRPGNNTYNSNTHFKKVQKTFLC